MITIDLGHDFQITRANLCDSLKIVHHTARSFGKNPANVTLRFGHTQKLELCKWTRNDIGDKLAAELMVTAELPKQLLGYKAIEDSGSTYRIEFSLV